jgi:hypothetical protein
MQRFFFTKAGGILVKILLSLFSHGIQIGPAYHTILTLSPKGDYHTWQHHHRRN